MLARIMVALALFATAGRAAETAPPRAVEGLGTKPSAYSFDETLDRLEATLKARGFVIFTRLDHAAAAAAVGLAMPRETVLVFGNPRIGTPAFLNYPTLAIDLPLKALVWADAGGRTWLSYNTQKYLYDAAFARHGAAADAAVMERIDGALDAITDAATK